MMAINLINNTVYSKYHFSGILLIGACLRIIWKSDMYEFTVLQGLF